MIKLVILVCALSPDVPCDQAHALDVIIPAERFSMPMACIRQGQFVLANTVLYPETSKATARFVCRPERFAAR